MTRGRTREEDMFLLNRVKELEADLERARAWITELEAGICEAVSKPYRLDEIAKRLTAQRASISSELGATGRALSPAASGANPVADGAGPPRVAPNDIALAGGQADKEPT
jgi:hypothetical protein